MESVAFPAISTGAFGYPMDEAARIAMGTVVERAPEHESLRRIRFVLFDEPAWAAHAKALERAVPKQG
jgi:O-acetyl-ADP-ribose deacetylase (regulator of RNase III)